MSTLVPQPQSLVLTAADARPGLLLRRAQTGDPQASRLLLGWAYDSARGYYQRKVSVEVLLSRSDAEELAGMFVLEFERAWPRIRCVSRYTRRMLRNNLRRYLRRKREIRSRETTWPSDDLDALHSPVAAVGEQSPIERWNDAERLQLAAVRDALERADPLTRDLMALRCGDPPLSYGVIAVRLGSTETALRMRATRFYRAVRAAHHERAGRPHSQHRRPS